MKHDSITVINSPLQYFIDVTYYWFLKELFQLPYKAILSAFSLHSMLIFFFFCVAFFCVCVKDNRTLHNHVDRALKQTFFFFKFE